MASPICLGNISKNWLVDNMKKTVFNGYVYDFSVSYDATDVWWHIRHSQIIDEKK